jgi:hypothetical protein
VANLPTSKSSRIALLAHHDAILMGITKEEFEAQQNNGGLP